MNGTFWPVHTACIRTAFPFILCVLTASVIADEQVDIVTTSASDEAPAVTEMRTRMKTLVLGRNEFGLPQEQSSFDFADFADEFGLNRSQKSLLPLLRDDNDRVREQAAIAAEDWLRASDLDEATLLGMLQDSSPIVKRAALQFLPDSSVNLETLLQLARDTESDVHFYSMEQLPKLIRQGNHEARALLLDQISSENAETAAHAMELAGSLGVAGRFAEAKLRAALADERMHSVAISNHFFTEDRNNKSATQALQRTGFNDAETAEALRSVCSTQKERFLALKEDEYFDDGLWVSAAIALAARRREFAPIQEAIFIRSNRLKASATPDTFTIETLLDVAPDAILDWEHGERVCRRLLNDADRRATGANWRALQKYPNATVVFEPEMQQYLEEESSREKPFDKCAFAEVVAFRAADGFSREDLDYSLRLVGLQHRSAPDWDVDQAIDELEHAIRKGHFQHETEMMMLDLLQNTAAHPDVFEELLERFPQDVINKSKSRLRLEKLLEVFRQE